MPDDDVAARYAAPPARLRGRRLVAAVAAAALALAAFGWWAATSVQRDLRWSTLTFETVSEDRVAVTFDVIGRPGDVARCVVVARSGDLADAGRAEADVGPLPDDGSQRATVSVRTITPASTAEVRTCVLTPSPLS